MAQRKRNKALDGLATLRASGALSATFHPDGSVASVVFGAVEARPDTAMPGQVRLPPAAVADEIVASPLWPKTDLDGVDGLPSFDEGN